MFFLSSYLKEKEVYDCSHHCPLDGSLLCVAKSSLYGQKDESFCKQTEAVCGEK